MGEGVISNDVIEGVGKPLVEFLPSWCPLDVERLKIVGGRPPWDGDEYFFVQIIDDL